MSIDDYARVEKAIRFIESNFDTQPSLAEIARSVHLSPYYFERLFKRWAGVTPKQFLQCLTLNHAKKLLDESRSTLEAAYATGLSGMGRLHDHFVAIDAMTPGQYKKRGAGLTIDYADVETPFGKCFLAISNRGVCSFDFVDDSNLDDSVRRLYESWSNAEISQNRSAVVQVINRIWHSTNGQSGKPLHLLVKGTNFQLRVWQALLSIPPGNVLTDEDIAMLIGQPDSIHAVSQAISKNPIAYLIPCHRVIKESGALGNYLWGTTRKKAILGREFAHKHQ
jgi:AraC family transcriptional regulator of adaptative response/methylated-DNA-[protein]-cysteine methyltransferase